MHNTSGASFIKAKDGSIWFVGIYSNNFKDREGEIITREAHENYVELVNRLGVKPPIIFLHYPKIPSIVNKLHYAGLMTDKFTPEEFNDNLKVLYKETAFAQADIILPLAGFVLVFGKVFDHMIDTVNKHYVNAKTRLAMSHGFLAIDKSDNIINEYFSHEFSLVPASVAANSLTLAKIWREETMDNMFFKELSEPDRELIESVFGDSVEDIEAKFQKISEIVSRAVESKTANEDTEDVATVDSEDEAVETEEEEKTESLTVEKIYEIFNIEELQKVISTLVSNDEAQKAEIEQLKAKLADIEADDDSKIAAAITNEFSRVSWMPAFKSEELDEEEAELLDELKKDLPEELVGDGYDSNNPMHIFWGQFAGQPTN